MTLPQSGSAGRKGAFAGTLVAIIKEVQSADGSIAIVC